VDDDLVTKLWDIATGEEIANIEGFSSPMLISSSRSRFVTAAFDENSDIYTFSLHEAADGSVVHSLGGISGYIQWVDLNSTGQLIAMTTTDDNSLRVWNLETGQIQLKRESDATFRVSQCGFSPDEHQVFVSNDDDLTLLLDAATGDKIADITGAPFYMRSTYSPDGKTMLTTRRLNNQNPVYLWNAETGELERVLDGHKEAVTMFDYSPDGQRLITASDDGTAQVWDIETGDSLYTIARLGEQVFWASFADDDHALVIGSDLNIRLYNLGTGMETATISGPPISAWAEVPFVETPDRFATGGGEAELLLWDIERLIDAEPTWESLAVGEGEFVAGASLSADGSLLATGGTQLTLWDIDSGDRIRSMNDTGGDTYVVDLSPDGRSLAAIAEDGALRVWDTGHDLPRYAFNLQGGWINDVTFSPDGGWMALVRSDAILETLDVETGEIIDLSSTIFGPTVTAISPDGKLVAYGTVDGPVFIDDAGLSTIVQELRGHTDSVYTVAFSPDGKTILTGSVDTTARLWNVESGGEIARLSGHTDVVRDARFSPDGSRIVTASDDRTACVWNAADGSRLYCLPAHDDRVSSGLFSADGQRLVTLSDTIRVWDITPEYFLSQAVERLDALGIDVGS